MEKNTKKLISLVVAFFGTAGVLVQFFLSALGIEIGEKQISDGLITFTGMLAVGGFAAAKGFKSTGKDSEEEYLEELHASEKDYIANQKDADKENDNQDI